MKGRGGCGWVTSAKWRKRGFPVLVPLQKHLSRHENTFPRAKDSIQVRDYGPWGAQTWEQMPEDGGRAGSSPASATSPRRPSWRETPPCGRESEVSPRPRSPPWTLLLGWPLWPQAPAHQTPAGPHGPWIQWTQGPGLYPGPTPAPRGPTDWGPGPPWAQLPVPPTPSARLATVTQAQDHPSTRLPPGTRQGLGERGRCWSEGTQLQLCRMNKSTVNNTVLTIGNALDFRALATKRW